MCNNRREIPDLEGFYANIYGFIQKKVDYGFDFVSTNKVGNGYRGVYINGKEHKVATLVAKTFPDICGTIFDGCEIDHVNTVRTDDRAENLRVCTHSENQNNPLTKKHLSKQERVKKENKPPKKDKIAMYSSDMKLVGTFKNPTQVEKQTGVSRWCVTRCCNGLQKKAGKPRGDKFIFKWL